MMKLISQLFFFTILLLVLTTTSANGQVKFSNEYLAIGVGARAHGMGKAVVANISTSDAGYWNPAGLAHLDSPFQVNAMHAEWFAGIAKYDYLSFAKKIGDQNRSAFGISVIRLGTDNIPYTFNLIGADGSVNYDDVTSFSAADYAVYTSYSRKIKNSGFTVGGSAKLIYRNASRFATAWGFGIDLGVQYRKGRFGMGLLMRDITSTFNAWKFNYTEIEKGILQVTGNDIPESTLEITRPRLIFGASFNTKKSKTQKFGVLFEANFDFTTDGQRNVLISSNAINMDLSFGTEMNYKEFIFVRAGINNFQKVESEDGSSSMTLQPNVGLGFKINVFNIDYALSNVGNVSDVLYSHIISLTINFKQKKKSSSTLNVKPIEDKKKKKNKTKNFPEFIEQID